MTQKLESGTELNWTRLYVPLDAKKVISEMFFPAKVETDERD